MYNEESFAHVSSSVTELHPRRNVVRRPAGEAETGERTCSRHALHERSERRDHNLLGPQASLTRMVSVGNPSGLHLRTCASVAAAARKHQAQVTIQKDSQTEDAASMLGLLSLAAGQGTKLLLSATGPEAQQALDALAALVAWDEQSGSSCFATD